MKEFDITNVDPRFATMFLNLNTAENNLQIGTQSDLILINFKDFKVQPHGYDRLQEIVHIDICQKNNVIIFISKVKGI